MRCCRSAARSSPRSRAPTSLPRRRRLRPSASSASRRCPVSTCRAIAFPRRCDRRHRHPAAADPAIGVVLPRQARDLAPAAHTVQRGVQPQGEQDAWVDGPAPRRCTSRLDGVERRTARSGPGARRSPTPVVRGDPRSAAIRGPTPATRLAHPWARTRAVRPGGASPRLALVRSVAGIGLGPARIAVAAQVHRHDAESFGQRGRDPMPHGRGLRVPVQQQQGRALTAAPGIQLDALVHESKRSEAFEHGRTMRRFHSARARRWRRPRR